MFTALPMSLPPSHNMGHSSYKPSPLSSSPTRPSTPLYASHQPRQSHSSPILPSNSNSNPSSFTNKNTNPRSNYHNRHASTNSPPRKRKDPRAFSKRPIKFNPLLHGNGPREVEGKENSRETRRKLFLKRVREDSEDKRWRDRGGDDELLRTIWVAEERRRLERKEREGNFVVSSPVEDEDDGEEEEEIVFSSSMRSIDEEMADKVAQQEDAEMEAMLAMMQAVGNQNQDTDTKMEGDAHNMDTPYGSDDEEYDSLLLDAVQAFESQHLNSFKAPNHAGGEDTDRMDES